MIWLILHIQGTKKFLNHLVASSSRKIFLKPVQMFIRVSTQKIAENAIKTGRFEVPDMRTVSCGKGLQDLMENLAWKLQEKQKGWAL